MVILNLTAGSYEDYDPDGQTRFYVYVNLGKQRILEREVNWISPNFEDEIVEEHAFSMLREAWGIE